MNRAPPLVRPVANGRYSCVEVGLSALAQPWLTKGGQPYPRQYSNR